MKKKLMPLVITTLIITLINTGLLAFLTYDKVQEIIKSKPVVISRDYDKGQSMELALEKNKPLIVWFYTDWCRYCQKFAPTFKKVANNKEIKKNFAIAYVNAEEAKNKIYTKEYKVEGYPMVFLVKDGKKELVSPSLLFAPDAENALKKEFLEFLK